MSAEWQDGGAGRASQAQDEQAANPFAPVDYRSRLKAPPKLTGACETVRPLAPGQLYPAARPLTPPRPLMAAPAYEGFAPNEPEVPEAPAQPFAGSAFPSMPAWEMAPHPFAQPLAPAQPFGRANSYSSALNAPAEPFAAPSWEDAPQAQQPRQQQATPEAGSPYSSAFNAPVEPFAAPVWEDAPQPQQLQQPQAVPEADSPYSNAFNASVEPFAAPVWEDAPQPQQPQQPQATPEAGTPYSHAFNAPVEPFAAPVWDDASQPQQPQPQQPQATPEAGIPYSHAFNAPMEPFAAPVWDDAPQPPQPQQPQATPEAGSPYSHAFSASVEPFPSPVWEDVPQPQQPQAAPESSAPPIWQQAPVAAQAATAADSLPSYLKKRSHVSARPLQAKDSDGTEEARPAAPAAEAGAAPRPRRRRADRNRVMPDEPDTPRAAAEAPETSAPSAANTPLEAERSSRESAPSEADCPPESSQEGTEASSAAEASPEPPASSPQAEPFDPYDHDDEPALPPLPEMPDAPDMFFPNMGEPGTPYAPVFSGEAASGTFQAFSGDGFAPLGPEEASAASQPSQPFEPFQAPFQPQPVPQPEPSYQPAPPLDSGRTQPVQEARPQRRSPAQTAPQAAPASRDKAAPGQAQRPPVRIGRVLALIAAAAMLLFCGVVGGRVISDLARNEREMKAVRDNYRERNGTELESGAARVELLPAGQTFAPTATPMPTQPVQTPTPTPVIPIREAAVQSLNRRDSTSVQETPEPSSTPNPRTRLDAYPDNPLRNVMESLLPLCQENADVIGQLTIPGVLDEVVVQRNNTYYLTRNCRGVSSEAGAVFADESCSLRVPPENLLLRGQSSVKGKTFAPLWQYATAGANFAASAATATLTTLYEEAQYTLFAVIVADSDPASGSYFNYASHPTFATDEAMLAYVESARAHSLYQFNVDVQASDRLLTLATIGGDSCLVLLWRMNR
ncbi:MAG: hypothetical protein MRZ54_06835 [Clostridiales bacterium]|nr:hypothetical protein [Clostridiales bacterium]